MRVTLAVGRWILASGENDLLHNVSRAKGTLFRGAIRDSTSLSNLSTVSELERRRGIRLFN